MIIWGGFSRGEYLADGASYDPQKRKWEKLPKAPIVGRYYHTAVWTGEKMIVWGGFGRIEENRRGLVDGASYDPKARRWKKLPPASIEGRYPHTAVWTGKRMIIWGGLSGG